MCAAKNSEINLSPFQEEANNSSLPLYAFPRTLLNAHAEKINSILNRYIQEQKIHHALLFTGIEGVGKKEVALELVRRLFCDNLQESEDSLFGPSTTEKIPCHLENLDSSTTLCASCTRATRNQWLDLEWITDYKVETFRELKSKMGLGPIEEPFRVVIISNAEQMGSAASNSILKALEEPPQRWLFILTTSDSARLLPTIYSRCMEVKLQPLTTDVIMESLKENLGTQFHERKAQFAAQAALGSFARAKFLMSDEVIALREQILGFFSNPARDWSKLVDTLAESTSHWQMGAELLETILHDLLKIKTNSEAPWIHFDQKEFLIQWYEKSARAHAPSNPASLDSLLMAALIKLAELKLLKDRPLNAKLFAQETLIPILNSIVRH